MCSNIGEIMAPYAYDLAILGSGPGGYVAAIKAAQRGLKTALIEQRFMGGTCLNVGCIPTKALLASADAWRTVKSARDYGISVEGATFDFAKIMNRKERVVKQLRGGVEFLMKKHAITVLNGAGTLTGTNSIGVTLTEGGEQEISAVSLILATGSVPARPPIPGLDGAKVVTSDEILSLPERPARLAVIGAGAIGVEFAYFFNALGTKVTILEALPRILPVEDAALGEELTASLKRQGIAMHTGASVKQIGDTEDGAKFIEYVPAGSEEAKRVEADLVLCATGRQPVTAGCGYEAQGVRIERRAVVVDDHLHTGVADIYAIGDVVGGMMLAHKASAEGAVAGENILGGDVAMHYHAIPSAVYTSPGVASVGLTEAVARERGLDVGTGSFPFRALGKAVAAGEREGWAKVVVDNADGAVIGAQAIGPHVSDLIAEMVVAVQHRLPVSAIEHTVHPHPTLSEVFHEAAEAALGHPLHL
jgi:dihydrolipoamide dehydrogenase